MATSIDLRSREMIRLDDEVSVRYVPRRTRSWRSVLRNILPKRTKLDLNKALSLAPSFAMSAPVLIERYVYQTSRPHEPTILSCMARSTTTRLETSPERDVFS